MKGPRVVVISIAAVMALLVALTFPHHLWVANRQLRGLSEPEVSNVFLLNRATTLSSPIVAPGSSRRTAEPQRITAAVEKEPLTQFLRNSTDPAFYQTFAKNPAYKGNASGFWSVYARKSAIWFTKPGQVEQGALYLPYVVDQLDRPEDTQMQLLYHAIWLNSFAMTQPYDAWEAHSWLGQKIKNLIRLAAVNVQKGGDYARYENGWKIERAALIRCLEKVEPYLGQDRLSEIDRSMEFHDATALKRFWNSVLPRADIGMRKDLALVAANLIRQGDPAVIMVVGRRLLADTVKPDNAVYRGDPDRDQMMQWARLRDREAGTGTYFTDLVAGTDIVPVLGAAPEVSKERITPLQLGSMLLLVFASLAVSCGALRGLSKYSQSDTVLKMRSHLLAALGWLLAVAMMPEVGSSLFGLVAASHLGLAFAVLSDKPARIGTGVIAALSFLPWFLTREVETRDSYLMSGCFFVAIAISAWLTQAHRWRFGLLVGWAVTLVCFGLSGLGAATLLPALGWIAGLLLEKKTGPVREFEISIALVMAAAGTAFLYWYFPGPTSLVAGLGLAIVGGTVVYRTNRASIMRAEAICVTLFALAYIGTTAWTLRFDRQNSADIQAYLTEADRIRDSIGW